MAAPSSVRFWARSVPVEATSPWALRVTVPCGASIWAEDWMPEPDVRLTVPAAPCAFTEPSSSIAPPEVRVTTPLSAAIEPVPVCVSVPVAARVTAPPGVAPLAATEPELMRSAPFRLTDPAAPLSEETSITPLLTSPPFLRAGAATVEAWACPVACVAPEESADVAPEEAAGGVDSPVEDVPVEEEPESVVSTTVVVLSPLVMLTVPPCAAMLPVLATEEPEISTVPLPAESVPPLVTAPPVLIRRMVPPWSDTASARIVPGLLITASITSAARRAVSSTCPPLALTDPLFSTSASAVSPSTVKLIRPSPSKSTLTLSPAAITTRPLLAEMSPLFFTWRPISPTNPPSSTRILPLLTTAPLPPENL